MEYGIARVVPFDGNKNTHLFTWSDEIPNTTWAILSGVAMFINTNKEELCNCELFRNFSLNTFKVHATRDIQKGEELFHLYKSLSFRRCFQELNAFLKEKKI